MAAVSRFNERKRVVPDEDMGPLVTEMTRCIQCTRCVRFTADVAGTYELGGMYRGENLQIGTFDGKPLTTELSGNVVDARSARLPTRCSSSAPARGS